MNEHGRKIFLVGRKNNSNYYLKVNREIHDDIEDSI